MAARPVELLGGISAEPLSLLIARAGHSHDVTQTRDGMNVVPHARRRWSVAAAIVVFTLGTAARALAVPLDDTPEFRSVSPLSPADLCLLSRVVVVNPMREQNGVRRWNIQIVQTLSSPHSVAQVTVRLDTATGHMTASVPPQSVVVVVNAPVHDDVLAAGVTAVTLPDGTSVECVPRPVPAGAGIALEVGPRSTPHPVVTATAPVSDAPLNCAEPFAPGGYVSGDGRVDHLTLNTDMVRDVTSYTFMKGGGPLRLLSGNFTRSAVKVAAGAVRRAPFASAVLRCKALTRPFPLTVTL
jgi:hypothetical protein